MGIVLLAAGIVAIALAAFQVRGPLATIRHLDRTAAELERYERWRGTSTGVQADGPTGADIMRQQMRQRVVVWGAIAVAGAVAVLAGWLLL